MESDMARLLAAQLGRPLQFRVMADADLLMALDKGDIDLVMSGWRITPERQQKADFSNGYVSVGLMAIIRTDDVMRFHNPTALLRPGYRLAVVGSRDPAAASRYAKENFPQATLVPAESSEAALQALLNKQVDVLLDDAGTSWRIATDPRYGTLMSLGRLLTEEQLAWAVRKGDSDLLASLNRALVVLRQTGVLNHVYNRWIPMNSATPD
jgi:polar amino acid transport system substrate-binding protein